MVKYECERCGLISNQRSNFKRHLNRKLSCNPIKNNISIEEIWDKYGFESGKSKVSSWVSQKSVKSKAKVSIEKKNSCNFCKKKFKHKQSRYNHMKKCKEKNEVEINKNYWKQLFEKEKKEKEEIKQREKEKQVTIDKLIKQVEILLTKVGTTTITNSNNTTNIILKNFGEENLSYLTNTFFAMLLNAGPYASIPRIVKRIHFNEKHPENMNLKVTDKTQPYIAVYDDSKWEMRNRKDVIKEIVNDNYRLIDSKYEDIQNGMDCNSRNAYRLYKNRMEKDGGVEHVFTDTENLILDNN